MSWAEYVTVNSCESAPLTLVHHEFGDKVQLSKRDASQIASSEMGIERNTDGKAEIRRKGCHL